MSPAFASLFQLAVPLGENLVLQSGELVGRGDVPERRVQPHRVVMLDVPGDPPAGFLDGSRTARPHALAFERAVPAFELAVGLRVVRRRAKKANTAVDDSI